MDRSFKLINVFLLNISLRKTLKTKIGIIFTNRMQ